MRRYPDASGNLILGDGDYGKKDGIWYVRPPGQHIGTLDAKHKVTEHLNDTITVIPSILLEKTNDSVGYHGHLIKGEFTEGGQR